MLSCGRYHILNFEQFRRLHGILHKNVEFSSTDRTNNVLTLKFVLKEFICMLLSELKENGLPVTEVRLNGGTATYVFSTRDEREDPYSDIDLIFNVQVQSEKEFRIIKKSVFNVLQSRLTSETETSDSGTGATDDEISYTAYCKKMVKVFNKNGDRWSLISLNDPFGENVELKFVNHVRRQFEFSVDSFQVVLDGLLRYDSMSAAENHGQTLRPNPICYPTVLAESLYGDFSTCLEHLHKKLIATRTPEEIRGGGLLKYCLMLTKNYTAAVPDEICRLERYMSSRFFIDFPNLPQQVQKLESYIENHFHNEDPSTISQFLTFVYSVVCESTVCLMNQERQSILQHISTMIDGYEPATRGHQLSGPNVAVSLTSPTAAPLRPAGRGSASRRCSAGRCRFSADLRRTWPNGRQWQRNAAEDRPVEDQRNNRCASPLQLQLASETTAGPSNELPTSEPPTTESPVANDDSASAECASPAALNSTRSASGTASPCSISDRSSPCFSGCYLAASSMSLCSSVDSFNSSATSPRAAFLPAEACGFVVDQIVYPPSAEPINKLETGAVAKNQLNDSESADSVDESPVDRPKDLAIGGSEANLLPRSVSFPLQTAYGVDGWQRWNCAVAGLPSRCGQSGRLPAPGPPAPPPLVRNCLSPGFQQGPYGVLPMASLGRAVSTKPLVATANVCPAGPTAYFMHSPVSFMSFYPCAAAPSR